MVRWIALPRSDGLAAAGLGQLHGVHGGAGEGDQAGDGLLLLLWVGTARQNEQNGVAEEPAGMQHGWAGTVP